MRTEQKIIVRTNQIHEDGPKRNLDLRTKQFMSMRTDKKIYLHLRTNQMHEDVDKNETSPEDEAIHEHEDGPKTT